MHNSPAAVSAIISISPLNRVAQTVTCGMARKTAPVTAPPISAHSRLRLSPRGKETKTSAATARAAIRVAISDMMRPGSKIDVTRSGDEKSGKPSGSTDAASQ